MHPTQYILAMWIVMTVVYVPSMLVGSPLRQRACWSALRTKKKYIFMVGCGSATSYLIVLYALSFTKASYVVALREVSIVFGTIFGILFLKEPAQATKIVGGLLVAAGLITIKFLG
eukprot:m.237118 g.237118  ORF g.237118 m.237118 type:complete len:116 (-) comp19363_c0_seq1:402-749(-)